MVIGKKHTATRAEPHIEAAHFFPLGDAQRAAMLFAQSVRTVEVEISSYCNRACSYCPNGIHDRRSRPVAIDNAVFTTILEALASIEYSGAIRLHRYNEPLADRDYALRRVEEVHEALPQAQLEIYTNGDFLDRDYVASLRAGGCHKIRATAHSPGDLYEHKGARARLVSAMQQLGYPYVLRFESENHATYDLIVAADFSFKYRTLDFRGVDPEGNPWANDRGGTLDLRPEYQRSSPCLRPFDGLQVDYGGRMLPCCQLRADIPGNEAYVLGQVRVGEDVFLAWAGERQAAWRRNLISFEPKPPPCANCDYDLVDGNDAIRTWSRLIASSQRHSMFGR